MNDYNCFTVSGYMAEEGSVLLFNPSTDQTSTPAKKSGTLG